MYISSNSLLSTGLVALRMVSASPLPSTHIVPRQSVDCEDPNETPDPSCWAILGVSNYVTNWTTTARTCPGTVDDAMCCAEGELWANCFIRLAMGPSNGTPTSSSDGNIHCDEIGTSACPSDFYIYIEDQDNSVKARYVVIAIQSINSFFSNWYDAVTPGAMQALLENQSLITELDPPKKTNFILGDLLTALTASLAFIGAPELGAAVSVATKAVLVGVQEAPGILKTIWPTGTKDSQSVQLGSLDMGLSQVDTNLTTAITTTLTTLMTDESSFSQFASNGMFTDPAAYLSVPSATAMFSLAFRTYVLSTAMTNNKWHALPSCDLTRADVESSVEGDSSTGCTLDSNNICSDSEHIINTWYSDTTACSYTLADSGSGPDAYQLMQDIVSQNWSTLEQLFDGALNCTIAGNAGQGVTPENIGYGMDLACMSQLALCSCEIECPVAKVNGACPVPCCSQ